VEEKRRTACFPPVRGGLAVAEDEDDEDEPGGDEKRAEPVHTAFGGLCRREVFRRQRGVGGDGEEAGQKAEAGKAGRKKERRAPARAVGPFVSHVVYGQERGIRCELGQYTTDDHPERTADGGPGGEGGERDGAQTGGWESVSKNAQLEGHQ
jgi:hypothetical protein